MKKVKDLLALLFWGVLGGTFFVGCILGFGYLINQIGEKLPINKAIFIFLLIFVMMGSLKGIAWLWAKTHKQTTKEATSAVDKLF